MRAFGKTDKSTFSYQGNGYACTWVITNQKRMEETNSQTVGKPAELQESNQTQLSSMNEEIMKSTSKIQKDFDQVVREAKKETKKLVSNAKAGAMAAYWGDALKY